MLEQLPFLVWLKEILSLKVVGTQMESAWEIWDKSARVEWKSWMKKLCEYIPDLLQLLTLIKGVILCVLFLKEL